MRADRDHRHAGARPRSAATSGRSGPTTAPGSRSGGRIDQGRPRRPARSLAHVAGPDVVQPGGGGVGALGADLAGQPVGEQVGQQQQRVGRLQRRGAAGGDQLVDRVERQLLQPVDGVQLRTLTVLATCSGTPRCGGRGGCRGCRAARRRGRAGRSRRPRSRCRCRRAAPVRATSASPASTSRWMPRTSQSSAADRDAAVGEAVHLLQVRGAPGRRGRHHPAAGGARGRRRRRAHAVGHRRNAAATPASTGMCSPVVWVSSVGAEHEDGVGDVARAAPRA